MGYRQTKWKSPIQSEKFRQALLDAGLLTVRCLIDYRNAPTKKISSLAKNACDNLSSDQDLQRLKNMAEPLASSQQELAAVRSEVFRIEQDVSKLNHALDLARETALAGTSLDNQWRRAQSQYQNLSASIDRSQAQSERIIQRENHRSRGKGKQLAMDRAMDLGWMNGRIEAHGESALPFFEPRDLKTYRERLGGWWRKTKVKWFGLDELASAYATNLLLLTKKEEFLSPMMKKQQEAEKALEEHLAMNKTYVVTAGVLTKAQQELSRVRQKLDRAEKNHHHLMGEIQKTVAAVLNKPAAKELTKSFLINQPRQPKSSSNGNDDWVSSFFMATHFGASASSWPDEMRCWAENMSLGQQAIDLCQTIDPGISFGSDASYGGSGGSGYDSGSYDSGSSYDGGSSSSSCSCD